MCLFPLIVTSRKVIETPELSGTAKDPYFTSQPGIFRWHLCCSQQVGRNPSRPSWDLHNLFVAAEWLLGYLLPRPGTSAVSQHPISERAGQLLLFNALFLRDFPLHTFTLLSCHSLSTLRPPEFLSEAEIVSGPTRTSAGNSSQAIV